MTQNLLDSKNNVLCTRCRGSIFVTPRKGKILKVRDLQQTVFTTYYAPNFSSFDARLRRLYFSRSQKSTTPLLQRVPSNFISLLLLHITDACIFPGPKHQKLLHPLYLSQHLRHLSHMTEGNGFKCLNASDQIALKIEFIASFRAKFQNFVASRRTLVFFSVPISRYQSGYPVKVVT